MVLHPDAVIGYTASHLGTWRFCMYGVSEAVWEIQRRRWGMMRCSCVVEAQYEVSGLSFGLFRWASSGWWHNSLNVHVLCFPLRYMYIFLLDGVVYYIRRAREESFPNRGVMNYVLFFRSLKKPNENFLEMEVWITLRCVIAPDSWHARLDKGCRLSLALVTATIIILLF